MLAPVASFTQRGVRGAGMMSMTGTYRRVLYTARDKNLPTVCDSSGQHISTVIYLRELRVRRECQLDL